MSYLFDTLTSVDVEHQELLLNFGVLFLIPLALFILSCVRVSSSFIKMERGRSRDSAASPRPHHIMPR
jgi:hypothetical protein